MTINKEHYKKIPIRNKEEVIKFIKDSFEKNLSKALKLERVSAPIIVSQKSGINDDLNGIDRKVFFDSKDSDETLEVIQSLAKWKRMALYRYNYQMNEGLYTDMNAIRRDEIMDEIHSLYVDQWDWEKIIDKKNRTKSTLKKTVLKIVNALDKTNLELRKKYPIFTFRVNKDVFFIDANDLLLKYPNHSAKDREYLITKEYKTVFIIGIGKKLSDGSIHDFRAPDYDDWKLNGDLLIYNDVLDIALEISSMGIRVDDKSMLKQLKISNSLNRLEFDYHKMVVDNVLPYTIGGGIGQSRICLLLMQQAHIGEVQACYWTDKEIKRCKDNGIELL